MLNFIDLKDFFLFIFYFVYAMLLPGYLLARAIIPPVQLKGLLKTLPGIERGLLGRYFYYLFAPAVGLVLIDAVVLVLAKFNQSLSSNNFFISFSVINLVLLIANIFLVKSAKSNKINGKDSGRNYVLIFIALFLGSVLIRTVFYLPNVVPQETDLGHHMYWSELMVQKETFPNYDTPEVIEGEHMVFAVLSKLSGISLLSAMPLIILSFYNLAMLLALYFGSMVITANRKVALWVLFFSGVYFAVDPPQARYVKGGVIGNTLGNLLIPLVFLLAFMFFRYFYKYLNQTSKDVALQRPYRPAISLISLILIIIVGSFYTHHLSTLLLGISLAVLLVAWIAATFTWNKLQEISISDTFKRLSGFLGKILMSPKFVITFLVVISFPIFIYLPHYLGSKAIETVTQEPEKDTHLGITLSDYIGKMGWTRFTLVLVAIIYLVAPLLLIVTKRYRIFEKLHSSKLFKRYVEMPAYRTGRHYDASLLMKAMLIIGWFLPLALLSFYPEIFKIDLPSRRVVNYLVFPSIILAAIVANLIFLNFVKDISRKIIKVAVIVLAIFVLWDGTSDFRSVYTGQNQFQDAVQLYSASNYLAKHTVSDATMLKDHRKIIGDTWIKFFLLRGYDDFLSRTYEYKYNDENNDLDPCTKEMIDVPASNLSKNCYGQTGINYVIVKPAGDDFLFWKEQSFNAVYLNDDIAIFSRSN